MADVPPELEPTLAADEDLRSQGAGPTPMPHELVAGRYEILGLLGAGGMGSVYRARDRELDEIVAFKVLRGGRATDASIERFRQEVKLARRVTHKNVARVFDIGENAGERYLTMELVDGESLAARLARVGALPLRDVVAIAASVVEGLAAAHDAGVIHRDLKPDNILLAKEGRVVLADFGIARAFASGEGASASSNVLIGTPAYMAPEQVQGSDVDARADIYALGAVLYEAATGLRPFRGDAPIAVAAARLLRPPPDPRSDRPDLLPAFAELVLRCLQVPREARFQSARELGRALAELALPSLAPPPPRAQVAASSREKWVAVLPFEHAAGEGDATLASDLTDDIADNLSMTRGLRVASRGAVARTAASSRDPRDVGRVLGVHVVVEGSIRRVAGRVKVSARVSSVADGFVLWVKRFDRPETDLLAVSDEVTRAIAHALTVEAEVPARGAIEDPQALDLYLRARREYRKFWLAPQRAAIELFEAALAYAPGTPTFLVGLALARARLAFFEAGDVESARAAALEALRLAPALPDGHMALAAVYLQEGDPEAAVRELKIALAGGPGLAEAHAALGRILAEAGLVDDAIRMLESALALDPGVPLAKVPLARTYELRGDSEKADALFEGGEHQDYSDGLARARFALWRRDPALSMSLVAQHGDRDGREGLPEAISILVARRDLGSARDLLVHVDELGAKAGGSLRRRAFFGQLAAEVAAFVEDDETALASIRAAVGFGLFDLDWMDHLPLFERLRAHPGFAELRAAVHAKAARVVDVYRAG